MGSTLTGSRAPSELATNPITSEIKHVSNVFLQPTNMAATLRNFEPYVRYCRFLVMPRGAEEFTETDDGVVIEYGEIRCRVMGHSRVLYSQKVGTRGALVNHVMEQHGFEVAPSDNEGRPSNIYLRGVKVTAETRTAQERERLRNSVPAQWQSCCFNSGADVANSCQNIQFWNFKYDFSDE
ncbi:hypothetical protein K469DRAFT_749230 [Zopfia rhizophila CBS 207.26]|uniref:Uncharacterized protein n=1 Tax=Zopfia rhizophila CBS 207.26 TaxID=1314779 RepID=A0A6A6EAE5_9PEZI|nr:hypothetical protein K469DRAFT_749230 [Zopfia rhizophila CBS 207.26]